MSDDALEGREAPSAVEIRVYQHGRLVERRRCETEEEAAAEIERWSELDDTECEVDDLSSVHRPGDILEPEPAMPGDDDYGQQVPARAPARFE